MPFAFNQIEPSRVGQIQKWDIPLNEWMGLKFSEGMSYGLGRAAWDFGEDLANDEGKPEDPKILNASFGIEGFLKFDKPMTIGRAALLRERKLEEMERLSYLEGAAHSWRSGKAAAGFLAGLAGGFVHPADLGTAFIPFVGSEAKAAGLARMGAGGLRQAIARGAMTQEAIGAGKAAALTSSMIDGLLSQAAVEVPIALQKHRNQADYTAEDSAFNIIFGGLFAGGLHLAGRGVGAIFERGMRRAAEIHSRLEPETKDALMREHEDAFLQGRAPETDKIIRLDENAIRQEVMAREFDEKLARSEAEAEAAKSQAEIEAEVIAEVGMPAMKGIEAVNNADNIRVKAPEGSTFVRGTDAEGRTAVVPIESFRRANPFKGAGIQKIEAGTIGRGNVFTPTGEVQVTQVAKKGRSAFPTEAEIERRVQVEKQKRIEDYVYEKKDKWQQGMEGRISAERQAVIAREQAQGKLLPKEEVAKYQAKAVAEESDIAMVEQDVASLERELKQMADAAPTPEEQAFLRAELRALMGEKESLSTPSESKLKSMDETKIKQYFNEDGEFDFKKWIKDLDSTASSDPIKAVLRHLENRLDVPIRVIHSEPTRFQGRYVERPSGTGFIEIHTKLKDGSIVSEKQLSRILAHEVIHRVVTSKIDGASTAGARMNYVFDVSKRAAEDSGFTHRGFKSVSEFVSEAMSSRKMMEFLAKTEVPESFRTDASAGKSKTLWNGFIDAVRRALGLSDDPVKMSALEEVVFLSEEIANQPRKPPESMMFSELKQMAGMSEVMDPEKMTPDDLLNHAISRLPKEIREGIDKLRIKKDAIFPSTLEGSGAITKGNVILLEKGEPVLHDTILHEVIHNYVTKHPELFDENSFTGMEKAVDKILSDIIKNENLSVDPYIQDFLRKELAELDTNVYTDQSPMVKAAVPCASKINA